MSNMIWNIIDENERGSIIKKTRGGKMATIALYADKINQMPGLIKDVKKSVTNYKSELSWVFRVR